MGNLVVVLMWKGVDVVFISAEYSDIWLFPRKERSGLNDENFLLEAEAISFLPNSGIWKRISLKQQSWAVEVAPSVVVFNYVCVWLKHNADFGTVSKLRIIVRNALYILEVLCSKVEICRWPCVLMAKEEMVLQSMIDKLIETGRYYGMEMNVEKTKVMRISR